MFEEMLGSFLSSTQGQSAAQALLARGIGAGQAQQILAAALPAATSSIGKQASAKGGASEPALGMFDLLGGHPGQAFMIGAATSMLRGEGVVDAMQDGAVSVVGAHVGEVIGSRLGLDRQMSAQISAAITPFIVSFVQEKLSGDPAVVAKHGPADPEMAAKIAAMRPMPAKAPPGKPMPGKQGAAMPAKGGAMPAKGAAMPAKGASMPAKGAPMPAKGAAMPAKPVAGKPIAKGPPGKPGKS